MWAKYINMWDFSYFLYHCTQYSVGQNWQFLRDLILDCMEKFVPKKNASGRQDLPWMTRTVKRLIRRKQRAKKQSQEVQQRQRLGAVPEAQEEDSECPEDSPLELPEHTVRGRWRKQQRPLEISEEHTERHVRSQYPCIGWKDRLWRSGQGWHAE